MSDNSKTILEKLRQELREEERDAHYFLNGAIVSASILLLTLSAGHIINWTNEGILWLAHHVWKHL